MLRKIIPFLVFSLIVCSAAFASNGYEEALREALGAYKKGDYKRAVLDLKKYVKTNPRAEAYYLLGYAHYKLGRHAEARRYFNEAYLIDPELKPENIFKEETGGK